VIGDVAVRYVRAIEARRRIRQREHIRAFAVAFAANAALIVFVTFNTWQVAHEYFWRAVVTQTVISAFWIVNVRAIGTRSWASMAGYIVGGVVGSAGGQLLARWIR
jgi:hypothetical protein